MVAKIVVVGSFNMDLTTYVPRMPRPGETIMGERFVTGPGGKGSNQAIAAARLGAQVTFVGRVGQDGFGETALKMWRDNGVDTRYVISDPAHATGVAHLPWHHRDPFDRVLVSQALHEELVIVSADESFDAYGVQRLW